jgi:hypothetical protein
LHQAAFGLSESMKKAINCQDTNIPTKASKVPLIGRVKAVGRLG